MRAWAADKIGGLTTTVPIEADGPTAVLATARPAAPRALRSRWWLEGLTVVWLGWVYDAITNLAPLRLHAALVHAEGILSLERTLHVDPEHALDVWLAGHRSLGLAIADYYDNAHFIVTLGLLGWLWWRRADIYRPLRNSLVLVNLLAFVVFWRYPVAPPRMLAGFTDVVASTHAIGSWHTGALASDANQLAAMPSLHIAWAVWCAVAVWLATPRRWLRALALLHPTLTTFAVLATGNHYVLDIVAGVTVMAASFAIVWWLSERATRPGLRFSGAWPFLAKSDTAAYRMSQTCYEVRDRVD